MKLKKLECPYCGGSVSIDKNLDSCFCPYCGRQFSVDDEVQRIEIKKSETVSYRDEAKLRELELKEQARERQEEEIRKRSERKAQIAQELQIKRKRWWKWLIIWFALWIGLIILALLVKKPDALLVMWGILWLGIFVFPSIYPKNEIENQAPIKTWFKWFGIIFGAMYISAAVIRIAGGVNRANKESANVTYSEISTTFQSDTTLDTVEGIKYKVPSAWKRTENDNGSIQYSPDANNRMYVLCMRRVSSYSTFNNQIEDIVKWLNEDSSTYDVSYDIALSGDRKIGIASGTIYQDDLECDLTAYILPSDDSNSKNVFIEIVVTAPNFSDPYIQDEQAVISSVLF